MCVWAYVQESRTDVGGGRCGSAPAAAASNSYPLAPEAAAVRLLTADMDTSPDFSPSSESAAAASSSSSSSSASACSLLQPVFCTGRLSQSLPLRAQDFARGLLYGNPNRGYVYSCPPAMATVEEAKRTRDYIERIAATNDKYQGLPPLPSHASCRSLVGKGALCRELMPPHLQQLVKGWFHKRPEKERSLLQLYFWRELCPFVDLLLSPNVYVARTLTSASDWGLGVFARRDLMPSLHLPELSGHLSPVNQDQLAVLEREEFDLSVVEVARNELHESLRSYKESLPEEEREPISTLCALKQSSRTRRHGISPPPANAAAPLYELATMAAVIPAVSSSSSSSSRSSRLHSRSSTPPSFKLSRPEAARTSCSSSSSSNSSSSASQSSPVSYVLSGPISWMNCACPLHANTLTYTRLPVLPSDPRLAAAAAAERDPTDAPPNTIIRSEWKSVTVGNTAIQKGSECTIEYHHVEQRAEAHADSASAATGLASTLNSSTSHRCNISCQQCKRT